MSTFIDGDGIYEIDMILIKLDERFLLFDTDSNFIDQISFATSILENNQRIH